MENQLFPVFRRLFNSIKRKPPKIAACRELKVHNNGCTRVEGLPCEDLTGERNG
jgi:hypothetical protein